MVYTKLALRSCFPLPQALLLGQGCVPGRRHDTIRRCAREGQGSGCATRQVDRFGYVKRAQHGTRMLSWAELRATYGRELVKLANESRYTFLNTLFSVSEAVMYMQARTPARQPGYQLQP